MFTWMAISTTVGGFVCAEVAKDKEYFSVLITMIIGLIFKLLIFKADVPKAITIELMLFLTSYVTGFLFGCKLAVEYKKRRVQKTILADNDSSLPDTL